MCNANTCNLLDLYICNTFVPHGEERREGQGDVWAQDCWRDPGLEGLDMDMAAVLFFACDVFVFVFDDQILMCPFLQLFLV